MTKGTRLVNKLMKLEREETFNTKILNHWIEELKNTLITGSLRCPCIPNFIYPGNCFYQEDYFKHRHKFSERDYCWHKCPRSKIWHKIVKYTKYHLVRKFKIKAYLIEQLETLL